MRILYVCDALAIYGGLERVIIEKANWLVEHGGYEVYLLTVNQGRHQICFPLHPNVAYEDLKVQFYRQYHLPKWKRFFLSCKLHRLFRERLGRVVNTYVPNVIVCTRLDYVRDIVRIKGNLPLVFESHSSRLSSRYEGDGLFRQIHVLYLQLAVKKVEIVVALTNGDADEWRKLTPKVCVIPNVVHLNKSGSYSDCTANSVIFVGRFSKQKDVGSLLRIWNLVHQRHPEWSLHIYGGHGDEQDALLTEIKKMDANIHVHEHTSDMIEKYKENSVLLMTSLYEPFGLVLPEAMSCGLPVVSFDCPFGPSDIIVDGVDGFLIKAGNMNEFVEKVCLLMEDLNLRVKMGKAGVKSSERYDVKCIMPQWNQLFYQLLNHSC